MGDAGPAEPPDAGIGDPPPRVDGGSEPACWSEGAELPDWIEAPASPADELHNELLRAELDALVHAVGRYTRGVAPLYAGELSARDNTADLDWRHLPDVVMTEGPVIARLTPSGPELVEPVASDVVVLYAFSAAQRKKIVFIQSPGAAEPTRVGPVLPYGTYGGLRASCAGCVTPFLDGPDAIAIDVRDASGEGGIVASAAGVLARVPPAEITWDQILGVNETPGGVSARPVELLAIIGGERVRTVTNRVQVPADDVLAVVGDPYFECERRVEYTATWWVDRACLGSYGVRDYEIRSLETVCCRCPGGFDLCSVAECEAVRTP
jgi:hypothetical protein